MVAGLAHPEEICRSPGSRVIYSTGCKIILVLLTVHSLMDSLKRDQVTDFDLFLYFPETFVFF